MENSIRGKSCQQMPEIIMERRKIQDEMIVLPG